MGKTPLQDERNGPYQAVRWHFKFRTWSFPTNSLRAIEITSKPMFGVRWCYLGLFMAFFAVGSCYKDKESQQIDQPSTTRDANVMVNESKLAERRVAGEEGSTESTQNIGNIADLVGNKTPLNLDSSQKLKPDTVSPKPHMAARIETDPVAPTTPAGDITPPQSSCGQDTESDRIRIAKQMVEAQDVDKARVLGEQRAADARRQMAKIQALSAKINDCAATKPLLDPMCVALASKDTTACKTLHNDSEAEGCRTLANFAAAQVSKDSSKCSRIVEKGARALCAGVVTGRFECPPTSVSPFAAACRFVAAGHDPNSCPVGDPDNSMMCDAVFMVGAVTRMDPALCERVGLSRTRLACLAFVQNDVSRCPKGTTPSPACREVVMDADVIRMPDTPDNQAKIKLWVINLFSDTAECDATIEVLQDGKIVAKKTVPLGKLKASDHIVEIETSLTVPPGELVAKAAGQCRWVEGSANAIPPKTP